ncbi:MAG: sulfatase-like hydrolase/transferase, partial [Planctomycetota bacterium]
RFLDAAALKRSYLLDRDYGVILDQDRSMRYVLDTSLVPNEDMEIYRQLYDASIRYLDDRLRELFALLEHNKMLDNTVVVLVSDHGEGLGDHGIFQHHIVVYDMLIDVPLTIYVPQQHTEAKRVPEAVSTASLFDVVCTALAAERCPDATTLAQIMVDRASDDPVVSEVLWTSKIAQEFALAAGLRPNEGVLRHFSAASDARMKYIIASDGSEELYDIRTDPGELHNLAGERSETLKEFAGFLSAWRERTPLFAPDSYRKPQPTPAQIDLLRSLGYVE